MRILKTAMLLTVLVCMARITYYNDGPVQFKPDPIDKPYPENRSPGSFALLAAGDGELPSLNWEQASDPDGDKVKYDVFVDTNGEPQIKVAADIQTTSFSITDPLDFVKKYYWKVLAKDSLGAECESEVFSFSAIY